MKTQIAVKTIIPALTMAGRLVRKSNLPILEHALLSQSDNTFEIRTTDLDNTLSVSIPGTGTPGEIAAPAKRLEKTVKMCHDDVEFESSEKNVLAVRNGSSFEILGLPAADFPPRIILENPNIASFTVTDLRNALQHVQRFQSEDETRFVLNGVCFEFRPEICNLIATDGRRMSVFETACKHSIITKEQIDIASMEAAGAYASYQSALDAFGAKSDVTTTENKKRAAADLALQALKTGVRIIIPTKAIELLIAALPKAKKDADPAEIVLQFGTTKPGNVISHACFTFNNGVQTVQLSARLIAGNYPNYEQVMPQTARFTVVFNRLALLQTFKTVLPFVSEKSPSIKLGFSSDNILTVTSNSAELGNGKSTMAIAVPAAATLFKIAFNPNYLIETLESTTAETVYADFNDDLSPVIIRYGAWKTVTMPMRLS